MTEKEDVADLDWKPVRSAESRYSQVARTLIAEIRSGAYALGEQLPTEPELQQRFSVSRHTIREALRELKSKGLIAAHPGIGTIVRSLGATSTFLHGAGNLQELIQSSEATAMKLIGRRSLHADAQWASRLNCEQGDRWVEVLALRGVPGDLIPIASVLLYLRHEHRSVVDHVAKSGGPVFSQLERLHNLQIVAVSQEIVAVVLDSKRALQLSAPAAAPALQITRHFRNAEGRSYWCLSVSTPATDSAIGQISTSVRKSEVLSTPAGGVLA